METRQTVTSEQGSGGPATPAVALRPHSASKRTGGHTERDPADRHTVPTEATG